MLKYEPRTRRQVESRYKDVPPTRTRVRLRGDDTSSLHPWKGRLKWPTRLSEAEIVAGLYAGLRVLGWRVRLDVPLKGKGRRCRLDIVVFRDGKPVRIIEVKTRRGLCGKGQLEAYAKCGVEVDLVRGPKGMQKYLSLCTRDRLPTCF